MSNPEWRMSFAALGMACAMSMAASATTIGFDGLLGGDWSLFTGHAESGFEVAPVSGAWLVGQSYGRPAPFLLFTDPTGLGMTMATLAVTSGGGTFTFDATDLYSSVTPISYAFRGTLSGQAVFATSGTVPNTFGNFAAVPNAGAGAVIDTLEVTLSTVLIPFPINLYGVDDIVVFAAASSVPEAPSPWLLGSALAALGGADRDRPLQRSHRGRAEVWSASV